MIEEWKLIEIVFDDILRQDVDVIVNPANTHMLHGGGLAAIIASAGGSDLVRESQDQAPIQTGEAIMTGPGNLGFKAVIHTVGPVWDGPNDAPYWRRNSTTEDPDELLMKAHWSAMDLAASHGFTSIAFPAVSCGVFRFPVARAAPLAIEAVIEAQKQHPQIERVVFCVLNDDHYNAFCDGLEDTLAAISEEHETN